MPDAIENLFGGTANYASLIRLIYEAVEEPALWHTVMERIAQCLNGQWTVLWPSYSNPAETAITAWGRMDPAVLPPYVEHYGEVNIIAQRIAAAKETSLVSYSHHVITNSELEKSEYYNDYLKPSNLFYTFGITVDLGLESPSVISSLRAKSVGPFGDREASILTALMPHIRQALRLNLRLGHLRSEATGLQAALDAFDIAVFGLNAKGKVAFHNEPAHQIARAGDVLKLVGGKLKAVHHSQNSSLQVFLSRTMDTGCGTAGFPGSSMLVTSKSGDHSLQISAVPFTASVSLDLSQVVALVFVADGSRATLSRGMALRALYKLSPTEAKLADLITAGIELKAAAEHLRLTENTARFHLKEVFRKAGVRSQGALIRASLALPGSRQIPPIW
jgi:DNA-binding CsgD family transcriptional regulator